MTPPPADQPNLPGTEASAPADAPAPEPKLTEENLADIADDPEAEEQLEAPVE